MQSTMVYDVSSCEKNCGQINRPREKFTESARAILLFTRAFLLSSPMEDEKFSFSIGVDNKKL